MDEWATDRELLRAFVERGSEAAFTALVQRHVDLVFAAALRRSSQRPVAEEITQNVFIALARKAGRLTGETSLAAWLHQATVLESRLWWRGELRRQRCERAAHNPEAAMPEHDSLVHALAAELDEALLTLRETDRQALLLRYFEQRSHREIGALVGTGEDAARKRVEQALDKLTGYFRRRGYAVPGAALTAAVLGHAAHSAPAGLAALAARAALQQAGAATLTGLSLYLAKLMGLTKTQTTIACLILAAAPLGYQWKQQQGLYQERIRLSDQLARSQQAFRAASGVPGNPPAAARPGPEGNDRSRATRLAASALPATAAPEPGLWLEDSPFVHVPKTLLARIRLPTLNDQGSLSEDMARALELNPDQIDQVNAALTNFTARYQALEAARFRPTDEHPTSMGFGPVQDQLSFVREGFPDEYEAMRDELKTALDQALSPANRDYALTNAAQGGHPEFDLDQAARAKRITIVRLLHEAPGGGPYAVGEEHRMENGSWGGSVRMGVYEDASQVRSHALLKPIIDQWKRAATPP